MTGVTRQEAFVSRTDAADGRPDIRGGGIQQDFLAYRGHGASSSRMVAFLVGSAAQRVDGSPGWDPGPASVRRDGPILPAGFRGDTGPDVSGQHGLAVDFVHANEGARVALEFAHHRRGQRPGLAVREVDPPLLRLAVVQAQREVLDMAAGPVDFELAHVGPVVPYAIHRMRAAQVAPRAGCG